MSSKRNIVLIGSLALVIIAVAGWFLLLSPRMATAGEIHSQRESVEMSNGVTQAQITELQKMKDDIGTAKADADLLTRRFPPTAAQSMLFEHIRRAAFAAGLPERKISTLTITAPTIGASDGSVSLGAPAAAPVVDPATGIAAPAVAPIAGAGGQLATMNVDLSVSGPQSRLAALLNALEDMDRAFLVTSVNLGNSAGGESTLTLTGKMFLLPELVDPTAPPVTPIDPAAVVPGAETTTDATGAPVTPETETEVPVTP